MQTDRRDRLRRLLIRSTELEIAVGIHWPELWGGLAALWATIGSLGMFPPLFLPTTPPYSVHRIHWYSYTDSYVPGCWVLIVVASRIPRSTYFSFTCSSTSLHILAGPSLAGGASLLVHVRFLSRCQPRSSAGMVSRFVKGSYWYTLDITDDSSSKECQTLLRT